MDAYELGGAAGLLFIVLMATLACRIGAPMLRWYWRALGQPRITITQDGMTARSSRTSAAIPVRRARAREAALLKLKMRDPVRFEARGRGRDG
jgi:hypothetical protein